MAFFSLEEFKIITSLGLMESITPEDIALCAMMNIIGVDTSKDVVGAIEGSVMGSSYRAGILRHDAIKEASNIDDETIVYGFLGPNISKLITEAALIKQQYTYIENMLNATPNELSVSIENLLVSNTKLRTISISIGVPILLPDGKRLLFAKRAVKDKNWEGKPWTITQDNINRWASGEWIDLRPSNMEMWQDRLRTFMVDTTQNQCGSSSRFNRKTSSREEQGTPIDVGEIVSQILIEEMKGGRVNAYQESSIDEFYTPTLGD